MDARPEPPPEGVLIAAALKDARISVREAARRAGISEGWWRQVVNGYQSLSGGAYGTVRAPAETLARMAQAAGVTADDLTAAGRADAAAELDRLGSGASAGPPAAPPAPYLPPHEDMTRDDVEFYEDQVRRDLVRHGTDAPPEVIFPGSELEQRIWREPGMHRETKVRLIAIRRFDRAQAAALDQRGRTGS
ncbi:MAG TPA: helix-turn-helix transcriptional regulator [Streptosporangiaceae bacterium]|nr:helix-turn-helix transcriptional regulator [Streptosporangiaceae bacterium]